MKYFYDLLKVILFVLIMYMPVLFISIYDTIKSANYQNADQVYGRVEKIISDINTLLAQNNTEQACYQLEINLAARNISTYILLQDSKMICNRPADLTILPPGSEKNSSLLINFKGVESTFFRKNTGLYDWSVSVITPKNISYWARLKSNADSRINLFKDFLLGVYIIVIFGLFAVLLLAESIQNTFRQQGKDPLWLKILNKTFGKIQLHDLKIIKHATAALIEKNQELIKDIDLLETSLEFTILNEIKKNNHQVPYTFYGTVSKVDINGFSKIVSTGKSDIVKQMTTRLEDFGCELLQRYSGLFEKTIGDEIVVVFKGEHSILRALAFSRDLMHEYSKIIFNIDSEQRTFTLKSAIYSSDITFLKRPSGYGFSGDALTYTTRLMDTVQNKEHNILSLLEKQSDTVTDLIQLPDSSLEFNFKNMPAQIGYHVNEFLKFENFLNQNVQFMTFFKSDAHVILMIETLQNPHYFELRNELLKALSLINIRITTDEVITAYYKLLKVINFIQMTDREISQIISLSLHLIPKKQWTSELTNALLNIPRQQNGRINATIIEAIMFHDMISLQTIDQTTFIIPNDTSGRTRGNLIVLNAIQKLENNHFNQLLILIKSTDAALSKSGLYAACQIIEYYKIKNAALLETMESYKIVYEMVKKLRASPNANLSNRLKSKMLSI